MGDKAISVPRISIVIPAKDERETLAPLYEQICAVLEPLGDPFEIIFIDDGSTDGSFEIMKGLHEKDPRVRVIRFRVNYGKSPALAVGFESARGEYVVTMDADLQDEPAEIPHLIDKINEGYDLVSGWKKKRNDPLSKRLFSKVFNYVVSHSTGIKLHDFNCGLKAYRRVVVKNVTVYGEMHRYIPVLAGWYGFRITEIPVTHHPRKAGRSKYGSERVIRGLLDYATVMYITQYRQRPSHLLGRLGLTIGFFGFSAFLVSLVLLWYGLLEAGGIALSTAIFLSVLGYLSFMLGLIAEMLAFNRRKNEPQYYINERLD